MKLNLLKATVVALTLVPATLNAQTNQQVSVVFNKVKCTLNTMRPLFNNPTKATSGFEDLDFGAHYIFASNVWLSGTTASSIVKTSVGTFGNGKDWQPGPYATTYGNDFMAKYNQFAVVTRDEINNHKQKFGQSGYVMPSGIANWPGSGNTQNGEAQVLAPFYDSNSNQVYEPQLGDYPIIKGDIAAYLIRNDNVLHTESGGEPLNVEMHTMVYAYNTSVAPFNRTVYVDYRIINRGSQIFTDCYLGIWNDFDLGNANDDYVGTLVNQEAVYVYNGDNNDDVNGGPSKGFGMNPPKMAMTILNDQLSGSMYYNIGGGPVGDPTTAVDYHNYNRNYWKDNQHLVYGGDGHSPKSAGVYPKDPIIDSMTTYMFPGDSDPEGRGTNGSVRYGENELWTEFTAQNAPGDRRMLASIKVNDFYPGTDRTISTAYVASFNSLDDDVTTVRTKTGIAKRSAGFAALNVYPNPAKGYLKLSGSANTKNARIQVLDVLGKEVLNSAYSSQLDISALNRGSYLVKVIDNQGTQITEVVRFIKE